MTGPFDLELQFTETYRCYLDEHPAVREAHCLRVMYPALFDPIRQGDLFAGRLHYPLVGLGLELASGGPAYYCHADSIRRALADAEVDSIYRERVEEMITFWETEATIDGKLVSMLPEDVRIATTNRIAEMGGRLAGPLLNFEKLVRVGLPGLIAEVEAGRAGAAQEGGDVRLYRGMRMALDLLAEVCRHYARQAQEMAAGASDPAWQADLVEIARTAEKIAVAQSETLREAMQLYWLYALISGVLNYGRMDVALGDFYAQDVESGRLTEAQALALLQSLWQLIADRKIVFNSRVIVGGLGRPNEANADRFALAGLEATRTVLEIEPQLSLRVYTGMNPALMQKALDVIGEGRTYPILYNDDVNVPAVQHAFGVSRAEAEQYLPYGCGEYALDHISFGSPNCGFNLLKALEATLHNGRDGLNGEPLGIATGELGEFRTFDDLFAAYRRQVEHHVEHLARRHALEYAAESAAAAFLYVSLLYDHCLERGKSVVNGGARYRGGIVETFGLVNTADSLTAIRELVYDRKLLTLEQLVAILDANFEGHERERQWMLDAPKYGNDDEAADAMVQAVSDHVASFTRDQAAQVGLDYFLVVNINNYANVSFGHQTAASAEGRRAGEPLANGNTPTAGFDRQGVTAFLNSIARVDPSKHAGYVHNMKFTRQMFAADRPKLEALLRTYFARGGTQAMITVVNRGDLERAMQEPERYRNLIVRVGGFSARFVELARDVQLDVLRRTLY